MASCPAPRSRRTSPASTHSSASRLTRPSDAAIDEFLVGEIIGREGLSSPNVVEHEPGMVGEDLLGTHAGSELAQDQLDRDACAAYHRLAAHDLRVDLDPLVGHGRLRCGASEEEYIASLPKPRSPTST